jgi:hypothetical protein
MRAWGLGLLAAALIAAQPAAAAEISRDPDLAIAFVNAIADICMPMVHGAPLTKDAADRMNLQPAPADAPVRRGWPKIPDWFASKAYPDSLYVGAGDKPNNCHLILANTTLTKDAQAKVRALLLAVGYKLASPTSLSKDMNDFMFAQETPEGVLAVSLQGPYDTVEGGKDDQADLHMGLIPKGALKPR